MKNFKIFFILILFSQLSFAQNRIVYGTVMDSLGLPIPGANILIEGTKTDVQSDFEGRFSIKVNSDQFLIFTYMGFFRQRVSAAKNYIEVIMQMDHSHENECIVPPIPVKREKFRNAITTISAEDLKNSNDPKYNFTRDYYSPLIFILDYGLKKPDYEFQLKYKISYAPIQDRSPEYVKAYNKLTFKHLKNKYKKSWQSEIRKDAIGLNEFLGID